MKESDYIDATNLANLRVAEDVLRHVSTLKHEQATLHLKTAQAAVRWLVDHYYSKVDAPAGDERREG